MNYKSLAFTSLSAVLLAGSVFAGNPTKIGTNSGAILRIPVGARGTALGGSGVANLTGVEAIFYNPAGLTGINKVQVTFSHMKYLADIDVNYGAVGFSMGEYGNVGLTFQGVNIGDILETSESAASSFTGRTISPTTTVIGLNYSLDLTDQVTVGTSANFYNEPLGDVDGSTVFLNFGVRYSNLWENLNVGVAFKNFGPDVEYTSSNKNELWEQYELPSYFQIGVGYNFDLNEESSINVEADFLNHSYSSDEVLFGAEYEFRKMLFLRAGYAYSAQDDYLYGMTLGAGLKYQSFGFDYAWRQTTDFFDHQQLFTFNFSF
ncbi:MAG: hypothetical protein DWQ06_14885 [Calditrichaeota bacterium]|nr:MAG: hypothetical protein DWQ06_14885 [Calditrichota bacterium]